MRSILTLFFILFFTSIFFAQGFQGPAYGKVIAGITLSTDDFSIDEQTEIVLPPSKGNKEESEVNFQLSSGDLNLGIFKQNASHRNVPRINSLSISEELNFEGPNAVGCWVPDCNITPGPVDVLIAINTVFWITDREGNLKKQINVNNWFSNFIGTGLVFDPKSFYDKRTKRFYMIYLYRDSSINESLFLVSVSDDSTAEGKWNSWSVRGDLNGSDQVEMYVDFPSMIVSNEELCVAVDMFPHTGASNPKYTKLRAFPISDLTKETPGELNYTDLWDFKNPKFPNVTVRTLKLIHDYDQTEKIYLTGFNVNTDPQTYVAIYEIEDIFGSTVVNSMAVSTSSFELTPHMPQKGGGKPMQLFHLFYSEMFRRNNKIYIAHSSKDAGLAAIHYMEVSTDTWLLDNEYFLGREGYYYGYPDLVVDEAENVFMVYQRTSADEYPGVYYSAKAAGAENFSDDFPLQEGLGNMNNIGCGTTNVYIRFADYTDIMLDPIEENKIWIMGEYIGVDNRWKTRIGKVSVEQIVSTEDEINIVNDFKLNQNYPNPFNPSTKISFSLPKQSNVSLKIFNSLGQEVSTLVDEVISAGNHTFEFNAENLPSGIYFYELRSDGFIMSNKMVLLK